MSTIRILPASPAATAVPDRFLDEYMPRANGEFVKVYLYLLRASQRASAETVSSIADRLHYTEQDVLRALKYWEAEKLLSISMDGDVPESVTLLNPPEKPGENIPPVPDRASERRVPAERIRELREMDEVKEFLFVAQQYLGRMLTTAEIQKLLYFYDELHFTADLIEFLIEYCVMRGHTNIRYIEKVGTGWYEEGIRTVKDARGAVTSYHKDYYDILKALGQGGRHPIDAEITLMKKWIEIFRFPMEIIEEACTRTVLNTKQPSVRYADGILTSWHNDGVRTKEDIRKRDEEYEARKKAAAKEKNAGKTGRTAQFEQREYDFDSLEARILKNQDL